VLRENCKSKQVIDFIAWPSRCHGRIYWYMYRAGTYFDADQKWRTEMHSGFIYETQNLWPQRFEVSSR